MAASIAGKWTGAIYTNNGPLPVSLVVNDENGNLSGSARTAAMNRGAPIENAEIHGDELSFEIHDDLNRIVRFRLILAGASLGGEATAGTEVSKVTLSRSLAAKIKAPTLIHKIDPEYTEEARAARLEGAVILYAEIAPDGTVNNLKILRSLGMGLDEKAIECVKQWKYKPAEKYGEPIAVAATIEVNFRLKK